MKLIAHQYGKERVRVLKVFRDGARHTVKELDVSVSLSGDFESSFSSDDNGKVVPTDTMRNTVNVLAKRHLGDESERFAELLARHFIEKYPQVETVRIETNERVWERMSIGGVVHPHSFSSPGQFRPFTIATASGSSVSLQSGIRDLLVLKSAESGFSGFPRCEYTTLPETDDRVLATSLAATWAWGKAPADYNTANTTILSALLRPFAETFSPSVQATLFQMGKAALGACGDIDSIHLAAPNKHCLLVNLAPFGLTNRNEIFVPTDEPHGQIEATLGRGHN
jgi:urate oxidase